MTTLNTIIEEEKKAVRWQDGMIVEFMSYPMHHNEGGGEEYGNELEVFQRGIILGDEVVGCDFDLKESDFSNGVYEDGTYEGGYRVDEYIKAVLVRPEWIDNLLTAAMQRAYEAGIDRVAESIDEIANGKYANAIYSWTPHDYMLHLDQLKKEIKG